MQAIRKKSTVQCSPTTRAPIILQVPRAVSRPSDKNCNGQHRWNDNYTERSKYSKKKPVLLPLCLRKIQHVTFWDWTRVSAVRGRRLTASAWVFPVNTMKVYRGSRGIAPLIPNLGTRWKWELNFTLGSPLPQGQNSSTHWVGLEPRTVPPVA
jgi:hypothetical protein